MSDSIEPRTSNDFEMNRPTIISLLYLGSFLAGVTALVGLILAYLWEKESHESWEDSHYRYHIRTFWIGLVYLLAGLVLAFVLIGFLVLWAIPVWFAVRAVKALLAAQKHEPIANVDGWLF